MEGAIEFFMKAIEIDNNTHAWYHLGFHYENILFQARRKRKEVNSMPLSDVTTRLSILIQTILRPTIIRVISNVYHFSVNA